MVARWSKRAAVSGVKMDWAMADMDLRKGASYKVNYRTHAATVKQAVNRAVRLRQNCGCRQTGSGTKTDEA